MERLIGSIRRDDQVGKILQIQMETHQMLIGSATPFFLLDPSTYSYGEQSRVQFLWEQCFKHGISIHFQSLWVEKIARQEDKFLMDEIVKKVTKPHVLRRMNDIQLYLRVSWLSDITNSQGTEL